MKLIASYSERSFTSLHTNLTSVNCVLICTSFDPPINQDSIISESTDLTPVNQTPTRFSGKTDGFLGGLETAQDLSQPPQNWGLWTNRETELVQHMQKRNDMTYNDKGEQCCTYLHWSAHLFQTALPQPGALFVV